MATTWSGPNWRPSRTARKMEEHKSRVKKEREEILEKGRVRLRDKRCRFPMCGCRGLRLREESAHLNHKGLGSKDDVSTADQMILLCDHRHRVGAVSWHKGTMRVRPQTADGTDGPVDFLVDEHALDGRMNMPSKWVVVASEARPGVLAPLTPKQGEWLRLLAEMDL